MTVPAVPEGEAGLTTAQVRQRLMRRYAKRTQRIFDVLSGQPEHAVLFEVPLDGRPRWADSVTRSRQRIDAVAVGLWAKSTQHRVIGFEIKVSRSDLLRELKDPSKAEAGVAVCNEWWLALGSPTLLRDSDPIPEGWGVLVPRGRGLVAVRPAVAREAEPRPDFIAGIVQAAMRGNGQMARGMGYLAGFEAGNRWRLEHPAIPQWQLDTVVRENARLEAELAEAKS